MGTWLTDCVPLTATIEVPTTASNNFNINNSNNDNTVNNGKPETDLRKKSTSVWSPKIGPTPTPTWNHRVRDKNGSKVGGMTSVRWYYDHEVFPKIIRL